MQMKMYPLALHQGPLRMSSAIVYYSLMRNQLQWVFEYQNIGMSIKSYLFEKLSKESVKDKKYV